MAITPAKLSLILSAICLISMLLAMVVASLVFIVVIEAKYVFAILAWVLFSHVINFYLSAFILRRKEMSWKISLIDNNTYRPFRGGSYLRFYLGFVWRIVIMNTILNPIIANLVGENGGIGFVLCVSMGILFVSNLWLLKYPYGDLKIRFNVLHKDILDIDYKENLPAQVEIVSKDRQSESIWDASFQIMQGLGTGAFLIIYFIVGLIQFAAIFSFFNDVWEWWFIPSSIVAMMVAYIPILGGITGIYSAYSAWGWPIWGAILLFCWPIVLMLCVFFFVMLSEALNWLRRYV